MGFRESFISCTEEVAQKLGISRQTVSKWETDESLPHICQSKRLAVLYGQQFRKFLLSGER